MTKIRNEVATLGRYSAPIVATQVGMMLMGVVDIWMVGRLGREALAAVALGDLWLSGTFVVGMGILMGIDPLVSQAHGAGDGRAAALALQRGVVLALLLTVPVSAAWCFTEEVLVAIGQSAPLAAQAETYTQVQIFGLAPFYGFVVLRQYLQGRELMTPSLWVIVAANLVNVSLNWLLIFGNLGFPALGIEGAGLATGVTRLLMFGFLVLWIWRFRLHRDAWMPWSREALRPRGLATVLRLGVPVGLHIGLEVWAFVVAALIAGLLGARELASHIIVLRLASLAFMVPLGISIASVTRVGNLVGAGRLDDAQRAAWVALAMGTAVMAISAAAFIGLRFWLPAQFTADTAVIALCASILPIAAAFQLFDGTQVVGCGILRGMGRTVPAALFNLLGFYLFALPLAWYLVFHLDRGLAGVWWGLCAGLGSVATLLVLWIWRRGPARLPRAAPALLEAEPRVERQAGVGCLDT